MIAPDSYSPRPIKRTRRTAGELDALLSDALAIIDGTDDRISIRHLFYRLVSRGSVPKTETAYDNLRGHLSKWRRAGKIDWVSFTDNTRWHIKTQTFDSMKEALEQTVSTYRRDLWQLQPFYVEAWVEKDAIAGFVSSVANSYGVPTFVCRGNASLTSLYDASAAFQAAADAGKNPVVLYLGDHDPTGLCIDRKARESLRDDFGVQVVFRRIAVTPEQIAQYNLPTRPAKSTDSRAKDWVGGCVEVDALEPAKIKALVGEAITSLIDWNEWEALQRVEKMERETIRQMMGGAR